MNIEIEDGVKDMYTNPYVKKQDIKDETIKYMKQQAKEHRQQLKIQCLHAALTANTQNGDTGANEVVATAKAFYAFVRT